MSINLHRKQMSGSKAPEILQALDYQNFSPNGFCALDFSLHYHFWLI